jgi:nicotinate-nucleotide--dimethylbenzimidazole phosphoribosyltransferase
MSSELIAPDTLALPDLATQEEVRLRSQRVLRPRGALQRLDDLAVWLAGWQRTARPAIENPVAIVFAGDHGVTAEGVSAYPSPVTAAMVDALRSGTATAAVMARHLGVTLEVIDVGIGRPTGNIRVEPALDEAQFAWAIEQGRAIVAGADEADLVVIGEIGIGNTTPAAAISLSMFGGEADDWVGPGSGLDPVGVARKADVVEEAVSRVGDTEPLEILRQLGGWELAAMAGAASEARRRSMPVLLDGFVTTAAVMPLEVAHPGFLDHCWPAHRSAEPGHSRLLDRLGRTPILELEMRLGEGSGALAALPLLALAARSVVDVATFEEWGLA